MQFKIERMTCIVMSVILLSCLACHSVHAQELKRGDVVPNAISPLTSFPEKELVVIQFWNTICGASVRSLAKIDSLQRLFGKDVQFVMVTSQPEEVVNEFFAVRKKIQKPQGARYFYSDTLLKKYFPYEFVPHNVWISKAGKVEAITSGAHTTAATIKDYLATKTTNIPQVKKRVNYDWKIPVLSTHYDANNKNGYHSYLLPAIDSFVAGSTWKKVGGSSVFNRVVIHKSTMEGLFMEAYNERRERFGYRYNNVEIKYKTAQPGDTTLFLYDLQVPETRGAEFYKFMRQDLERVFNFKASIEKKSVKCLMLKATGDTSLAHTKGGTPGTIAPKKKGDSLFMFQNLSMQSFVYVLRQFTRHRGYEVKDETGIYSNVDIAIRGDIVDVLNIAQLRKDLSSYGILVEEGYCETEILVLTEQ